MYAKWGGATANHNPHLLAYPDENWVKHSQDFMASMELELTMVSTQIEPHDYMAEVFQNVVGSTMCYWILYKTSGLTLRLIISSLS